MVYSFWSIHFNDHTYSPKNKQLILWASGIVTKNGYCDLIVFILWNGEGMVRKRNGTIIYHEI